MPVIMWQRLWQWNAQRPGLSAAKAMVTLPIGGTRTVARNAPASGVPFIATTWKAWPWRCIGWAIIERFTISIATRWPLAIISGFTLGQYSPFRDQAYGAMAPARITRCVTSGGAGP